jgi:hypothetical protein
MNLIKLIFIGAVIQGASLITFIAFGKTDWDKIGKPLSIWTGIICTLALCSFAMRFPRNQVIVFSGALSITFVLLYEVLGFFLFPGLVKDLLPFSWEHFRGSTLLLVAVWTCYGTSIYVLSIIKKLKDKMRLRWGRWGRH